MQSLTISMCVAFLCLCAPKLRICPDRTGQLTLFNFLFNEPISTQQLVDSLSLSLSRSYSLSLSLSHSPKKAHSWPTILPVTRIHAARVATFWCKMPVNTDVCWCVAYQHRQQTTYWDTYWVTKRKVKYFLIFSSPPNRPRKEKVMPVECEPLQERISPLVDHFLNKIQTFQIDASQLFQRAFVSRNRADCDQNSI